MKSRHVKVVHIVSGDLWAGAEVQLYTLCKYLNRIELTDVKVILLNYGELTTRLINLKIDVTIIDESCLNSFQIIKQIIKLLNQWKPDLVHTHRQKENILGSIAAKICRIKSLRTVHGMPEYHTGWKQPYKATIAFIDNFTGLFLQKKIVSISFELTTHLVALFNEKKLITIENGLDMHTQNNFAQKTIFSGDQIHIGIVGRLVPIKQMNLFIDTAKILFDTNSDIHYQFFIYGDGPLKEELNNQINTLQIAHKVALMGHSNDILKEIGKLDILLITSKHEGLPMTLLEAMYLGTPVISNAIGGIPHVLHNENCGTLVKKPTAKEFAKTIKYCIKNNKETEIKVVKARQRIKQFYSAESNALRYLELYQSLAPPLTNSITQ